MISTPVRAAIENGKLYSVVCEYNNGNESFRYIVSTIYAGGDVFGVLYETTGDKETLCRLFADRYDGKVKPVRVIADASATDRQRKAANVIRAHYHAAHCLSNGMVRVGILASNREQIAQTVLETIEPTHSAVYAALGY